MTTKPDRKLIRFSNWLMALSIYFAVYFGFGNITSLCYEMGKDDSDTFIWFFLIKAINIYAIFFIAALTYVLSRNARKGIIFSLINQRILLAIGLSTCISGILINAIIHLSPIEMSTDSSLLLIFIGLFVTLVALMFKIGIQMKEEQDLTI